MQPCQKLTELQLADVVVVQRVLSQIHDRSRHDTALTELLGKLNDGNICELHEVWLGVLRRALGIQRAPWKVIGCGLAQSISARQKDSAFADLVPLLSEQSDTALQAVDSDWDRTDLGFTVAEILGDSDLARARSLIQSAHETRQRSLVPDGRTAASYIQAARLTIRAFLGLLPRQLDVDQAYNRLHKIINHLPSEGERVLLWSELALRCFATANKDLGIRVVNDEIRVLCSNIADQGSHADVLVEIAPALYYAHSVSALRDLENLEEPHKSSAFENICWFILHRLPLHEPIAARFVAKLTANDVDDFLECLKYINNDASLGFYVEQLTEALTSTEGLQAFTRASRVDVARRLQDAIRGKLPWKDGIAHEGYAIVIKACVAALEAANADSWKALADEARSVLNTADRSLILGMIARHAPSRFDSLRIDLIEEARGGASLISAPLDRLERLRCLADWAYPFDVDVAKKCLNEAFQLSVNVNHDVSSQQRAMVDLANRISDEFAKSLISQLDNDPAVLRHRTVKKRNELSAVLRKLPKDVSAETIAHLTDRDTAELCGMMLTGLHDGSVAYIPVDKVRIFLSRIMSLSFRESYRSIGWAIENSVAQHARTPYGTGHLVDIFGACATASELGMRLMSQSAGYQSGLGSSAVYVERLQLIEPGERTKAIRAISEWIRECDPQVLKVCDPYFTLVDLELLKIILEVAPLCSVQILTGEKKQLDSHLEPPFDIPYGDHWKTISQNDPPRTGLVVAGLPASKECPIHERWMFAAAKGLRLGNSFSGLGKSRVSEISNMTDAEVTSNEATFDQYFEGRIRDHSGGRIRYFRSNLS